MAFSDSASMEKSCKPSIMSYHEDGENSLVSLQTLLFRCMADMMREYKMTLSMIPHVLSTQTAVHPQVARVLMRHLSKMEDVPALLAQDFVLNDKLEKMAKNMCKIGFGNVMHGLLAMDGLGNHVKLDKGPSFDCKRYLDNLCYSLDGRAHRYEEYDPIRLAHVLAVRKVYEYLLVYKERNPTWSGLEKYAHGVYQMMREILKDEFELPEGKGETLSNDVLSQVVKVYLDAMGEEKSKQFVSFLKTRRGKRELPEGIENLVSEDDEPEPKRKRMSAKQCCE